MKAMIDTPEKLYTIKKNNECIYEEKYDMRRKEAENLLDDYLDTYETMRDYVRREDYLVWTQEKEDNAMAEYEQVREKLIELICR